MNRSCQKRLLFLSAGALFLLFLLFTAAVSFLDVQPIGPLGSSVGLASFNGFIRDLLGIHLFWYVLTDWLGMAALLCAGCFAVLGLYQLVRRRSLWKVDRQLLLLGAFYILVLAAYLLFERLAVNCRPILLDGVLEASYPSSHTMLVLCVLSTAIMEFHRILSAHRQHLLFLDVCAFLLMAVTVAGRLLSGVHWCTDIIGAVLLSAVLVCLYAAVSLQVSGTYQANVS